MKTVVIIGAGPAGLTAAYDLKKQSGNELRVILLEESGEIGGISRTVRHNGCRIDLGGHRFFSKNEQVNALWQEIMPMQGAPSMDDRVLSRDVPLSVGGPDPEQEDRVMLSRHRVSAIWRRGCTSCPSPRWKISTSTSSAALSMRCFLSITRKTSGACIRARLRRIGARSGSRGFR